MRRRSSVSSDLKMIVSSMRLRNSGRKIFLTSLLIRSWDFFSSVFSSTRKPTEPRRSRYLAPMLEVMITMVFLKSMRLPRESVRWPSSNTCSRMLYTSKWAFSISSSRMTEYGLRFTFSVSWPPSSCPT